MGLDMLETVRVSHWPITWPIYLPCTVTQPQGQSHCASNIISNSQPFHSKWVDPTIPEIQQFQYFTLKIQGQGHRGGQSSKSQHGSNILSIQIPFFPVSICPQLPFLWHRFFQNFTLKIQGQGHSWRPCSRYNTLSTHIPFVRCQWAIPFLYTAI